MFTGTPSRPLSFSTFQQEPVNQNLVSKSKPYKTLKKNLRKNRFLRARVLTLGEQKEQCLTNAALAPRPR